MNYTLLMMLLVIPPVGSLLGQRFVGWNSDRTHERRLHAAIPIYLGAVGLFCTVATPRPLPLFVTVVLFTLAATGLKAYLPAFWTLPSLFLTEAAAAGSIGLINSVGNLGGFVGPFALGWAEKHLHTFRPGILFLCISMTASATIIVLLGIGRHTPRPVKTPEPVADALAEPL
jgi:ACS family tartrate transporter-like MFS transporter